MLLGVSFLNEEENGHACVASISMKVYTEGNDWKLKNEQTERKRVIEKTSEPRANVVEYDSLTYFAANKANSRPGRVGVHLHQHSVTMA